MLNPADYTLFSGDMFLGFKNVRVPGLSAVSRMYSQFVVRYAWRIVDAHIPVFETNRTRPRSGSVSANGKTKSIVLSVRRPRVPVLPAANVTTGSHATLVTWTPLKSRRRFVVRRVGVGDFTVSQRRSLTVC